jgi:hypothetical protein
MDTPIFDKDNLTVSLDDSTFSLLSTQNALTFRPSLNLAEIQGTLKTAGK